MWVGFRYKQRSPRLSNAWDVSVTCVERRCDGVLGNFLNHLLTGHWRFASFDVMTTLPLVPTRSIITAIIRLAG